MTPTVNGTELFVREWPALRRRGSLLLVHGLGEHSGRYAHVAAVLNDAGLHVRAYDQRGFGRSGGARATLPHADALVDDATAMFDALAAEARAAGEPAPFVVGHSMGGLVARSACHYAEAEGRPWTDAVRHVFCLGTPHLGADLEKGVNVLGWALGRLPETRGLATVLNARSLGIKDLRFGSCVEEDWSDCEPDEFLRDRCNEVPFLPDANYYFVGATLGDGPLGSVLGDLLVRMPSASGRGTGRGRSIPFEVDHGHELSGLTHFDLLNHPDVYAQIRSWITRPPTPRAPRELEAAA